MSSAKKTATLSIVLSITTSCRLRIGFCVLNFLSILPDFLSHEKMTQKRLEPKAEQLQITRIYTRNSHLAPGKFSKLLFLSILLFKVSFVCKI